MSGLKDVAVNIGLPIRQAVQQMDNAGFGFLVCLDDQQCVRGVLTDGDFRRAILKGQSLDGKISEIMNTRFFALKEGFTRGEAGDIFDHHPVRYVPVTDDSGKLLQIYSEAELRGGRAQVDVVERHLDLPVAIMAGGKGSRLEPFTKVLPKPLVPIGEKPIIQLIMEAFKRFGMDSFYISVNHKQRMIKAYFDDHPGRFEIEYLHENKPLGTAGSLKFLQGKIDRPLFVSNCDILINDDYAEIYDFHQSGKFDLTIVAAMHHHTVPYGVCEIGAGGQLKSLTEKPTHDLLVNTGFYLLQPQVLEKIPQDTFYHITDLIDQLRNDGGKVGVYPVSEGSWIDIGQWEEYRKSVDRMKL